MSLTSQEQRLVFRRSGNSLFIASYDHSTLGICHFESDFFVFRVFSGFPGAMGRLSVPRLLRCPPVRHFSVIGLVTEATTNLLPVAFEVANCDFKLIAVEFEILPLHSVTSRWGGRRSLPLAFTEYGAIMAAIRALMAQPKPAHRPIGFTADVAGKPAKRP